MSIFHTLLHTEENLLKVAIFQYSLEFLHKLYKMRSVIDGVRAKQIMDTIEEILNQRYVILQLFHKKKEKKRKKKIDNREKKFKCQSLWCPSYSLTSSQWLWRWWLMSW